MVRRHTNWRFAVILLCGPFVGCSSVWPWRPTDNSWAKNKTTPPTSVAGSSAGSSNSGSASERAGTAAQADKTIAQTSGTAGHGGGVEHASTGGTGLPAVPATYTDPAGNTTADNLPAPVDLEEFTPAQIVATVGNLHILAGDIDGNVNLMIAPALAKMSPQERERIKDDLAIQKKMYFRQQLQSEIQTKLGYLDFMRTVPPDKAPEIQKRIAESFEKDLEQLRGKFGALKDQNKEEELSEIARREPILLRNAMLMKQFEIETLGDLDRILRRFGSSLEKQQRAYGEQKLMQMMVMKNIRKDVEVTHEEMLAYYKENQVTYAIPAKARWEQLSVRFDKFPSEQAAFDALAEMGNEVYLGGAALSAVAKRSSQEPNAESGGVHDWTNRGSLASKPLDEAIFTLPTGKLSQIIRDDRGLHIVRVLERTDATHTPFLEAQVDIKDRIRANHRQSDVHAYLEKIRKSTKVWTIFDAEKATAGKATSP